MTDEPDTGWTPEQDAQLLAELDAALGHDRLPAGLLERAEGLVAWMDVDRELAALADETAADLVGARGSVADDALLTFEMADGSVALEVAVEPDRIRGQLLAGSATEAVLESPDGTVATSPIDDLGAFSFPVRSGSARVELHRDALPPVATDWFTL